MLCNDHGRFLEIADVIHRLEVTILKGAMEKRPDESAWAHFIVEVQITHLTSISLCFSPRAMTE